MKRKSKCRRGLDSDSEFPGSFSSVFYLNQFHFLTVRTGDADGIGGEEEEKVGEEGGDRRNGWVVRSSSSPSSQVFIPKMLYRAYVKGGVDHLAPEGQSLERKKR